MLIVSAGCICTWILLQHFGFGRYCELFRRLEIGRPMCELCNENREIWEELWQEPQGLGRVSTEDRRTIVDQMPAILDFCAERRAEEKAEAELAAKYLAGPQMTPLPNARADGRVALWLEKKSPARTKGWQPRWFVFCPHTAHAYYFEEEEDEDLENREDKRWLSLALVTRITSNNFESGHFEFHTKARSMELRVPSKMETDLQPIRELLAALKELGAFPVETLCTIEPSSTALEDAAADAKRKQKAAQEAATKAAKLSASPAYLAAVRMSFDGLGRGTWLKVLKSAEVSAPMAFSKKVGQLEEGEQLRVLEVKNTEPGGFTKVRFDNGTLKGWVDVVTWDCDILMKMMDEQQMRDAWRTFETTSRPRAGADAHVGWYRAQRKAVSTLISHIATTA
eukprot:COSAG02_NODE_1532_length_12086_cov_6.489447_2_plen_396_part_00